MALNSKYIEDKYIDKLISYKYKGGDDSILCRFVIDPFCNYIVNYFPTWLAPNVINIYGWFLNLFNTIITIYFTGWKGGEKVPLWACITVAICYTTYIILDFSDGKQARRLKASSPLGLLIDHGTDACTTFYVPIFLGGISFFTEIHQYLLYYFTVTFTFFMNTWEEYYKGELILPIIHGVSEGTIYLDLICILSGVYGSSLYCKKISLFGKFNVTAGELNGCRYTSPCHSYDYFP